MQHFNSAEYWEQRYKNNRTSGSGSYGQLAYFKAEVINGFISEEKINSVIELGCGDGNQLRYYTIPNYVGLDISNTVIELCRDKFKTDLHKKFYNINKYTGPYAELAISIDVLFHLVEDNVFEQYMTKLFRLASNFIIIYSSNDEILNQESSIHVKHRKFTDWIEVNAPSWSLYKKIPNRFPCKNNSSKNNSFSDFFIYKQKTKTYI